MLLLLFLFLSPNPSMSCAVCRQGDAGSGR